MAYKRKYRKGERIKSLDELMKQECVYVWDKVTALGWFGSWQLRLAKAYIDRGCICRAERVE